MDNDTDRLQTMRINGLKISLNVKYTFMLLQFDSIASDVARTLLGNENPKQDGPSDASNIYYFLTLHHHNNV